MWYEVSVEKFCFSVFLFFFFLRVAIQLLSYHLLKRLSLPH